MTIWQRRLPLVQSMLEEGFTQQEIANHLGVSKSALSHAMARHGLRITGQRSWTLLLDQVQCQMEDGWTRTEMAHYWGVTPQFIGQMIRRHHLDKSWYRHTGDIADLLESDVPVKDIAFRYGLTVEGLTMILNDLKLKEVA